MLPVNTQEIDRHPCQHDGQAGATHHGLRPQAEDQQEGPEQQVDDGEQQADLWIRGTVTCTDATAPGIRAPSPFLTHREALGGQSWVSLSSVAPTPRALMGQVLCQQTLANVGSGTVRGVGGPREGTILVVLRGGIKQGLIIQLCARNGQRSPCRWRSLLVY